MWEIKLIEKSEKEKFKSFYNEAMKECLDHKFEKESIKWIINSIRYHLDSDSHWNLNQPSYVYWYFIDNILVWYIWVKKKSIRETLPVQNIVINDNIKAIIMLKDNDYYYGNLSIEQLFIKKEYRKNWIWRKLLNYIIDNNKDYSIVLNYYKHNHELTTFYKNFNCEIIENITEKWDLFRYLFSWKRMSIDEINYIIKQIKYEKLECNIVQFNRSYNIADELVWIPLMLELIESIDSCNVSNIYESYNNLYKKWDIQVLST